MESACLISSTVFPFATSFRFQMLQGWLTGSSKLRFFHRVGILSALFSAVKAVDPNCCHGLYDPLLLWWFNDNLGALVLAAAFGASYVLLYIAYGYLGQASDDPIVVQQTPERSVHAYL